MPQTLNQKKKQPFYLEKFNLLIFILFLIILLPGYLFLIKPAHGNYQENKKLFDLSAAKRDQNLNILASYQKALAGYKDISSFDQDKINAILPDYVDKASLYINLESLVASLDIALDSIAIETIAVEKTKKPVGASADESAPDPKAGIRYAQINLDLSQVSYAKLKELFVLIENNLRLLDITSYSFNPTEAILTISLKAYYNG